MTKQWTTEEIKALLAAATPAPWDGYFKINESLETLENGYYIQAPDGEAGPLAEVAGLENTQLLAAAPEIIQQLLNQLERKDAALKEYANAENWCPSHNHSNLQDWWMPDGDGWELAQKALEGES